MNIESMLNMENVVFPLAILMKDRNYPKTSVKPERKVMVRLECDYTGRLDGENGCELKMAYLPCEIVYGLHRAIYYSKEFETNAMRDCFNYCVQQSIYPQTKHFTNYLSGLEKSNVKVRRSSGIIEDNWNIRENEATGLSNPTSSSNTDFMLVVTNGVDNKCVMLVDFIELNELDKDGVVNVLSEALKIYFNIDQLPKQ